MLRVKNYVLDTNVLLHDPNSLLSFQKNNVLIPIEVIEEIDRFKRESTELGQNARTVSRTLDGLRGKGRLSEGVDLENGGCLRIAFRKPGHNGENGHLLFGDNTVDSRILAQATAIQKAHPKLPTILVSKDINLRIKADALGLQAEDYETDRVLIKDLYTGMVELMVSADKMAAYRANGELELNGGAQYHPNEYCTLTEEGNPKRTALTKVDATGKKLVPIIDSREGVWGIKPRNREQAFCVRRAAGRSREAGDAHGQGRDGQDAAGDGGGFEEDRARPRIPPAGRGAADDFDGQGAGFSARIARGKTGAVDAAHP